MRFRQIEAFRATIATGSMTKAANLLCIAQPSISRLISDLEESVGFQLFQRRSGSLTPTVEGLRFHTLVENTFVGLDKLKRGAAQIRQAHSGHLTVATMQALSATIMPAIIKLFLNRNPGVSIDFHTLRMAEIMESIQAQQTDVAVSLAFAEVIGVRQEPLIDVRFVCALPSGHPLAEKEYIDLMDFNDQDYISLAPSTSVIGWERIEQLLDNHGVRPRRQITTAYSHTAYSMVAAGLGISLIEPFAGKLWSTQGVVVRPLSVDLRFTYSLFFPENNEEKPLVIEFIACVRDYLRENPPLFNAADQLL